MTERPTTVTRGRLGLLAGGVACLAAAAIWGVASPEAFFPVYLFAFIFWASLPLGAACMLMLHLLVGGRWGWSLRGPIERAVSTIPALLLLFAPIMFGLPTLYLWARSAALADHPDVAAKAAYLNPIFFLGRAIVILLIWTWLAFMLNRAARRGPADASAAPQPHVRAWAAGLLILYWLTASVATVDWIASLMPTWYSTIFPMYVVMGQAMAWLAAAILILSYLRDHGGVPYLEQERVRLDLGNLLLTLVVLHAYAGFSQLLIIWSGDKPHEIVWYLPRIRHGWQWATFALAMSHFFLPFFALLVRTVKSDVSLLRRVAMLVLASHALDCVWMVMPGTAASPFAATGLGILLMLGLGAVWFALFLGPQNRGLQPPRGEEVTA